MIRDGKGWHGDTEGHRKAARKVKFERIYYRIVDVDSPTEVAPSAPTLKEAELSVKTRYNQMLKERGYHTVQIERVVKKKRARVVGYRYDQYDRRVPIKEYIWEYDSVTPVIKVKV